MTKKVATKMFLPVMLVLLAALPAVVMAQEGDENMAGEEMMMATVSCQQDYTVQADDWLSKIAEKFYGDVLAFPAIAEATNTHHDAAMMAGDTGIMAEDDAMMAEDDAMMTEEAMAGDEAMMAGDKLMLTGADGQMMEAMMAADGKLMVKGADGQMIEVTMDAEGHMMAADGSMVDGKLVLESADGQMMDVMMVDGKLMTMAADGEMMDVAMADHAMEGEMMAEDDAMMADKAMAGDEAMMTGSYALVENPDLIEPGWVLCIPSPEDAQMLLSEAAAMAQ